MNMKNYFTKKLNTLKQYNQAIQHQKKINQLEQEVTENDFVHQYKGKPISIPKDIRAEYMSMFKEAVLPESIIAKRDTGFSTSFQGVDCRGVAVELRYSDKQIELKMSDVIKIKANDKQATVYALLRSTHQDGKAQYKYVFGENFAYNSGYTANHSFSKIIDKVQKSKVIPAYSETKLSNRLPQYKEKRDNERKEAELLWSGDVICF